MLTLELKKEECEILAKIFDNYSSYLRMETTMINKKEFETEIKPQTDLIKKIKEQLKNARSLDL